ncbi:hypothetical protein [Ruegeria sp. Ofav3-42]|uniref:hypothetical protein n=1 Tax=Ruegeria sp. Ofav3-42 TaxID=2917759 RepID=UPI001EF5D377|nr:hypothetical protein [Ruegeria sp. Ofav3-42]MCG7518970.1 hypothetical protein [Ruegeria sp. Ofav3-42]
MTDKVANSGVEDVLSSIKRLVGEKGQKALDTMPSSIARKPGRLVLTDALRVGGTSSVQDGPENEPEAKEGYTADASVKPMLLRACDIVAREDSADNVPLKPEQPKDATNSLSAKIEALEAAIARTEDQWEPDGDSEDAYSGTPTRSLDWSKKEDTSKPDTLETSDAASETEVDKEKSSPDVMATFIRDPDVFSLTSAEIKQEAESPKIDEEALRKLIAQVVREELQGVLGERITRNVRKMVRREIYKALAEQELE